MNSKDELSKELKAKLKEFFVDEYEKANNAKENINSYLESIEVYNGYEYNDFCTDFLRISEKLIQSLTLEDIEALDSMYIMTEIMSIMCKYKIMESEIDEKTRTEKLLQHELRSKATMGFDSG